MAPAPFKKNVISMSALSKICYAVFFISSIVAVVYSMVMIWGERGGENAWKSLGTALIFLVASLLILVANNIMWKNKWG